MAENYESVFSTVVRPNGAFDWRATKTWIRSFWGATMGQIFKILTWRDFGPSRQWSWKFPSMIYYPFWPRHGRKFRSGLFDQVANKWVKFSNLTNFRLWAPKMGKKSWRKTIGVKGRSEILSPGQNFLFWPIWYDVSGGTLQSAECHPCTSDSLRNFAPVVGKVSPQDFLSILGAPQSKITNRSFRLSCDQIVLLTGVRPKPGFCHFEVLSWVIFSKFWPGETSDLYANGSECFPPRFFYPFLAPHGRKLRIGLFDRRVTKIYVRSFWPLCDKERPQKSATNGGLIIFLYWAS